MKKEQNHAFYMSCEEKAHHHSLYFLRCVCVASRMCDDKKRQKRGDTHICFRWRRQQQEIRQRKIFKRKRTYLWHFKCLCSMNHNEVIICRIDTDFIFWLHTITSSKLDDSLCLQMRYVFNKSLIRWEIGLSSSVYLLLLFCNLVYLGFYK